MATDKMGVRTILHEMAETYKIRLTDAAAKAHKHVSFFKHADRDPTAELIGFRDEEVDDVLLIACHDFGRVKGGMPVEAQLFEAWYHATRTYPLRSMPRSRGDLVKRCFRAFPVGLRSAPRKTQKQLAQRVLQDAISNPSLRMEFKRIVDLTAP